MDDVTRQKIKKARDEFAAMVSPQTKRRMAWLRRILKTPEGRSSVASMIEEAEAETTGSSNRKEDKQ